MTTECEICGYEVQPRCGCFERERTDARLAVAVEALKQIANKRSLDRNWERHARIALEQIGATEALAKIGETK